MQNNPRLKASLIISDIKGLQDRLMDLIKDHLSHPAKDYSVTYKDKQYHFYPAFDQEDAAQMKDELDSFVFSLVRDAVKGSVSSKKLYRDHAWDSVIGVLSGEEPSDHQFVKFDDVEIAPMVDAHGEVITSLPLNVENYQVKENLGLLQQQRENLSDDNFVEMIHFSKHMKPFETIFDENDQVLGDLYEKINKKCIKIDLEERSKCKFCQELTNDQQN